MARSKRLSLRARALMLIVSTVLIGFIVTIAVLTYQAAATQKKVAMQYAQELATGQASAVTARLDSAFDAARFVAQSLGGLSSANLSDRAAADAILKNVLEHNPKFLGVWVGWEPNAFDGRDAQFAGKPGHDSTGRYIPYWNRASGAVHLEALVDYDKEGAGDYYQLAKRSGAETVIDPYVYAVGGKNVLMTTLAVPIQVNGRFAGVAGVDLALSDFQDEIGAIRLYDEGYVSLISNGGKYVSDIDAAQVGKPIEAGARTASLLKQVQAGERFSDAFESDVLKQDVTRLHVPVRIGTTTTPWSLAVTVPDSKVLADVNRLRNTALLLGLLSIVGVSIGLSFVLDRLVIKPIGGDPEDAADVADRVSKGDLSVAIDVKHSETQSLMLALKHMQAELAGVVSTVRQNADRVAEASSQIAQGNDDLSTRTQAQASALEETAASMEEMTATVKQTADNATQASELAVGVRQQADDGGAIVTQAVNAMNEINTSSRRIADIISVIDEIAFQTNLLALNAAVEAARAGEQGRGFAVVATEVRNLAQRSASAAKEIKTLIEDSVAKVQNGSALVDRSGEALTGIVDSVKKLTDVVAEIAAASREQASGIDQVNHAVTQMDQAVQENAALVEESAAATESLKTQSQKLVDAAAIFKLPESTDIAAPAPVIKPAVVQVERRGRNRAKNVVRPAFGERRA